jgi:hypothetical protein
MIIGRIIIGRSIIARIVIDRMIIGRITITNTWQAFGGNRACTWCACTVCIAEVKAVKSAQDSCIHYQGFLGSLQESTEQ